MRAFREEKNGIWLSVVTHIIENDYIIYSKKVNEQVTVILDDWSIEP